MAGMWSRAAAWLLLLASWTNAATSRDYDSHDYYAVHLSPRADPEQVSSELGLHYDGPLGELKDHYIFRASTKQLEYDHIQTRIDDLRLRRSKRDPDALLPHLLDDVRFTQKQEIRKRFPLHKRQAHPPPAPGEPLTAEQNATLKAILRGKEIAEGLSIRDPNYPEQWHLYNPLERGHDINVTGVWQQGITGKGSTVCFVDDGLDMDSEDLRDNYFAAGSYDFNDHVPDPKPRLADDHHGTRCAGEVAAVRNDLCGVGVAYDSKVSGIRILSKVISDADEAAAMNYAYQENLIYSCSWGPPDDGKSMDQPGILIRKAMVNGVQNGRGGLGSIYVFAIGNGAANDDNCNFDGYTNSIYSVSVGSIDRMGLHPYYSEKCSAQLVVTYSSGSGDAIHTTDIGLRNCYDNFGGTSAAGPLVAGIYALVLEANPKLTWRDIQWMTVLTAVKVDQPADWELNKAVNKEFSHDFGYGKADAWALVEAAKTWTNVKPQSWLYSPWLSVSRDIPQGNQGLISSFEITGEMMKEWNLERIEHVTVTMNVEHTRRGDLSAELHSPSGMVSHIATARRNDDKASGYIDWTFMSVAHWGESGVGTWTVVVKDTVVNEHTGKFVDWHLKLWGECIDAEVQKLLPPPDAHDDDHPDLSIPTQTASAGVTSVTVPTETGLPPGNPTDHQHRPVRPTPTDTAANGVQPPAPTTITPIEDDKVDSPSTTTSAPSSSSTESNFLPRPFPTFGVSKRTQVWIYGAVALIVIFLIALGTWWFLLQRRRRRWMSRGDYGFEMVDNFPGEGKDADNQEGTAMLGARDGRRRKRAGELYDAFAEGDSEDEEDDDELFDVGHESEDDEPEASSSSDGGGHRKEVRPYRDDVAS